MFCPKFTQISHSLHSLYKEYCLEVPKQIQTTKENFFKVNKIFVETAVKKILEETEEVKFPMLGSFRIKKFKQNFNKRLYVDHKKTVETGIKTYHLNEDRDGYVYKWYWNKNLRIQNIIFYSFLPARYSVRRKLPAFLKVNKNKDFFE